jgi:hypothetical protein
MDGDKPVPFIDANTDTGKDSILLPNYSVPSLRLRKVSSQKLSSKHHLVRMSLLTVVWSAGMSMLRSGVKHLKSKHATRVSMLRFFKLLSLDGLERRFAICMDT